MGPYVTITVVFEFPPKAADIILDVIDVQDKSAFLAFGLGNIPTPPYTEAPALFLHAEDETSW